MPAKLENLHLVSSVAFIETNTTCSSA
jgi:hypothetical protein